MTTTTAHLEIDDYGYPVEESLRELLTSGYRFDEVLAAVEPYFAERGWYRSEMVSDGDELIQIVRLVTGGWSGTEEVISALERTMGWQLSWESSHRGGKHVLHVKPVAAGMVTTLGQYDVEYLFGADPRVGKG